MYSKAAYLSEGKKAETDCRRCLASIGVVSLPASPEQDMLEHWDFKARFNETWLKVDAKGMKKLHRGDEAPNEHYHYLEILHVQGKTGWAYGQADLFAFETQDYFILVPRERLQALIKQKVQKTYARSAQQALYRLYRRTGRADVITLVKTLDLAVIASDILKKG